MNLRVQLAAALAGATSQSPIDTDTLAKGHCLHKVKAVLMEMYNARQVMCCQLFKGNNKSVVQWWPTGALPLTPTQLLKRTDREKRGAAEVEV